MKVRSYFKALLMVVVAYQSNDCVHLFGAQSSPPLQAPIVVPVATSTQASTPPQPAPAQVASQTPPTTPPSAAFTGPDTNAYPEEVIGSYGNWIKKREWWQDARKLSLEMGGIIREIAELHKTFRQKYLGIKDQTLNFYEEVELGEGKLEWLFASLDKYLEKKRREEIASIHEKNKNTEMRQRQIQDNIDAVEETIKLYKGQLEQLKFDMQSIDELEKSLLDRLNKIAEHIKQVNQDATQVNETLNTMVHVIDHNKARELYYKLKNETIGKLEAIKTYLSQTLMQDFDTVSATLNTQMDKTRATIRTLEQNGLIIKDRARKISEIKEEKIRQEEIKKDANTSAAQPKRRIKKEVASSGWFSPVTNFFVAVYDAIVGVIASVVAPIKSLISPEPPKKRVPRPVTPEEPPVKVVEAPKS